MQLTQFTNYAFRVLIYLSLSNDKPVSVREIADSYGISFNHLRKVIPPLLDLGYLKASRGRYGGVSMAKDPRHISVGQVVREMEPTLCLFECFDKKTKQSCPLISACQLKVILQDALKGFMAVLDQKTLADLVHEDVRLKRLLTGNYYDQSHGKKGG